MPPACFLPQYSTKAADIHERLLLCCENDEEEETVLHTLLIVDDEEIEREGIWKQGIRSVFRRIQKIRTLLLSEKSSDFVVVVHLQGLEPWAH